MFSMSLTKANMKKGEAYNPARFYRIQSIGSMFIIRAKDHLKYEVIAKTKYPSELKRTSRFLTNDFTIKANNIAMLYKQR